MVTLKSLTDNLVKLGLNSNEAKIIDSLLNLGPSGASDIHSYSGVPRNKIYEILGRFAERGLVELQPGRPLLYRIASPDTLISDLVDQYRKAGEEIREKLEELRVRHEDNDSAYAWVVRGKDAAKRKLADLIYSARKDIFWIGSFPSEYIDSVTSALKAAKQRGIKTRPVCMVRPMETGRQDISKTGIVEFRTIKDFSSGNTNFDGRDMEIMGGFRDTAGYGGVAIIDESLAFNIVDEGKFPDRVTGILIKAPGAPRIQKGTIERILALYTRKL